MTKTEFKNLKRQLNKVIQKLEDEALEEGENITSSEFQSVVGEVKARFLAERGIALVEYERMEAEIETAKTESEKKKDDILGRMPAGPRGERGDKGDSIKGDKGDRGDSVVGPKGDKGDKGDAIVGLKGDKGDTGPIPVKQIEKSIKQQIKGSLSDPKELSEVRKTLDGFVIEFDQFKNKKPFEGLSKITVSEIATESPQVGDLWIDIR